MESGGTGTVTSAVLRDDGLMHYAALCSVITHRDLYVPWLYHDQPYFSTVPKPKRRPKNYLQFPTIHHEVIRARLSLKIEEGKSAELNLYGYYHPTTRYGKRSEILIQISYIWRIMYRESVDRKRFWWWKIHPGAVGMALKS